MKVKPKFGCGMKLLLSAVVILLLGIGTLKFWIGPRGVLLGYDRTMQRQYDSVPVGLGKQEVVSLLGKPRESSMEFHFSWISGSGDSFDDEKKGLCVEYLLWSNGGNWFYCIGFDEMGRVRVKGEGHS